MKKKQNNYTYQEYPKMIYIDNLKKVVYNLEEENQLLGVNNESNDKINSERSNSQSNDTLNNIGAGRKSNRSRGK